MMAKGFHAIADTISCCITRQQEEDKGFCVDETASRPQPLYILQHEPTHKKPRGNGEI